DQGSVRGRAVAGLAGRKLGLPQGANSFLGSYTATALTDKVLQITVNAPSGDEATTQARTLATEFLQYRAQQLEKAQQQTFLALDQQVNQAQQQINATRSKIAGLLAQPRPPTQQGMPTRRRTQVPNEKSALFALQKTVNSPGADPQDATASQVNGSYVLAAAAVDPPHSKLKHLVLY